MASKKTQAGFDYLVAALKANKDAAYADLKANAEKKGLTVYPIMFGRAKAMLGLVKAKSRGQAKTPKEAARAAGGKRGRPQDGSSKSGRIRELLKTGMSAADIAAKVGSTVGLVYNVKSSSAKGSSPARAAARRGPGRPRKGGASGNAPIDSVVEALRENDRERARLSRALEQIRGIVESL